MSDAGQRQVVDEDGFAAFGDKFRRECFAANDQIFHAGNGLSLEENVG